MTSSQPRLNPREHGAYAMLAFPCLSGLVIGGLTPAGLAFTVASVTGFLAHESTMILSGARGARIQGSQEAPARRRLVTLGAMGLTSLILFAVLAPAAAYLPAAAAALLAGSVGVLLLLGWTKTLPGELLVAAAFASIHAVLASAGGSGPAATVAPAAAWAGSFALATLSVHALKYRFKGRGPGRWTVVAAPLLAVLAAAGAAAGAAMGSGWTLWVAALAPKAVLVAALAVLTVHPRHLKRVGWSLVAADALTLTLLVWAVRAG